MDAATALAWLESRPDITSQRAAVCDLNGILRGKRVPVAQVPKVLEGAMRMPYSITCLDIWGEDVTGNPLVYQQGDIDGRCEPTGRGFLPMNWLGSPTALLPLWMLSEDGAPYLGDPRRALAAVCERFAAHGLRPVVATELEFYLVDTTGEVPTPPRSPVTHKFLDGDGALSIDDLDHFEAYFTDVYAACDAHGVPVDSAISENGGGQFEINLLHVPDPLKAADDALYFKRFVKGIARKYELAASFMAKPFLDRAGNGFHVHFSLLDREGRNVFDSGTADGSEVMRHAVGGVLAMMRPASLVFAPHRNSYRRLTPNAHVASEVSWGYETRAAAVRIPGGSNAARRVEHRVAGADANPYLVLAAVLGAALEGIENAIEPPDPGRPSQEALPIDWKQAIDAFEGSEAMGRVFAPILRETFVGMKKQELQVFSQQISPFEHESYLETV
ncbi:MAG TPA: glutamine synthetase family protein [Amaricoccus sp.]|nr:glutamine synthetase family protein [Amaricoccus sp.]